MCSCYHALVGGCKNKKWYVLILAHECNQQDMLCANIHSVEYCTGMMIARFVYMILEGKGSSYYVVQMGKSAKL